MVGKQPRNGLIWVMIHSKKIADSTSEKIAQDMGFDIVKAGKLIRDAKILISDDKIVYRYWQSEKKTK